MRYYRPSCTFGVDILPQFFIVWDAQNEYKETWIDMAYSRIDRDIWTDWKFRKLMKNEQFTFISLLTHYRGNMIGCYILPLDILMTDCKLSEVELKECLSTLQNQTMIHSNFESGLMLIRKHFKYNPPPNPSVATKCMELIKQMAMKSTFEEFQYLVQAIMDYADKFSSKQMKQIDGLLRSLNKQEHTP